MTYKDIRKERHNKDRAQSIIAAIVVILGALTVTATANPFSKSVTVAGGIAHQYYYTWGIESNVPSGETIDSATFTYVNVYDWKNELGDKLYTNLLSSDPISLGFNNADWDGQGGGNNFNDGPGGNLLIGEWEDPQGGSPYSHNETYIFDNDQLNLLNTSAADGYVGFGIDPDCHYYFEEIEFSYTTSVIPAPGAILFRKYWCRLSRLA